MKRLVFTAATLLTLSALACAGSKESTQTPKEPSPTATESPTAATLTATPPSMVCGSWTANSSPGSALVQQYGDIRTCRLFGDSWVIIASNKTADGGAEWAIGVYRCAATDAPCHDGRNDHPLSGWTFYSPPYQEKVTIVEQLDSDSLVLDNDGHRLSFDIATGSLEEK